jgi:adenosine deaminase
LLEATSGPHFHQDLLLFGTSLLAEYEVARDRLGRTDEELAACAWTSVSRSAAPPDVGQAARQRIDDWLGVRSPS